MKIDGVVIETIDEYVAGSTDVTTFSQPRSYTVAAGVSHTITIRVTGQKNPSAMDTRVGLDYFNVSGAGGWLGPPEGFQFVSYTFNPEQTVNLRAPSAELAPGQAQTGVERLSAGSGVTKYYYFGSQRVALQTAGGITYLHADHLGSTSVTSGAVSSTQVYYPYGSIRAMTGSVPTDYGFTGQRLDSSSALMYYGARYYDAVLGRFVEADTTVPGAGNPQSLNRYAYVNNNPLAHVDSSGHCWGAASGIRGVWSYDVTCGNLDMALTIVQSPNASAGEKAFAGGYIAFVGAAHVGLAIGVGIIAWEAGGAAITAGGGAAATCVEADCEDKGAQAISEVEQAISVIDQAGPAVQGASQPVLGLSQQAINDLAEISTVNPNSKEAVLGTFENGYGYTQWGNIFDKTYLNMPSDLWQKFGQFPGDFRLINQQFLVNNMGKTFILSTPWKVALQDQTTNLWWEVQFLLQHGYTLVTEDGIDKLVPK